ncbi:transposase for element [Serratia symbiotica]|uniref:Transposase for element n=1 Tax=Serratia symbiotica TaxID=138074 RepID=A0A455VUL8_9GAMM|nr:transposase for element [Serratia symbiotica]
MHGKQKRQVFPTDDSVRLAMCHFIIEFGDRLSDRGNTVSAPGD